MGRKTNTKMLNHVRYKPKSALRAKKEYWSSSKARRNAQVSQFDFRRLCILKGIYPREPRNRHKKGFKPDAILYRAKDVRHLLNDPMLETMLKLKTWHKKIKRAEQAGDFNAIRTLVSEKPKMNLDHVVKERYPTFEKALQGMDDALSVLALFAHMPKISDQLPHAHLNTANAYLKYFKYYVSKTNSLRKTFVSIKGIYYSVDIYGHRITWLEPHNFNMAVNASVGQQLIVISFLEFYLVYMGFVMYRLFNQAELAYPPKDEELVIQYLSAEIVDQMHQGNDNDEDEEMQDEVVELDNNVLEQAVTEQKQSPDETPMIVEEEADVEADKDAPKEEFEKDRDALLDKGKGRVASVFKDLVFYLGRETPMTSLAFVIMAAGGAVTLDVDDEEITHVVWDRHDMKHRMLDRDYVQPQWVYDSLNFAVLLPVSDYAPGAVLPPHLSPYTNYGRDSHVPAYKKKVEIYKAALLGHDEPYVRKPKASLVEGPNEEQVEDNYARELQAEREGNYGVVEPDESIEMRKQAQAAKAVEEKAIVKDMALEFRPRKVRKAARHHQRQKKKRDARNARLAERAKKQ